ncbi:hypothetical protein GUJ93_ZPchr0011g27717 [Zizania palustris]|uniref:Embryonic stem cell-specific 5-hydroxymethylcytosine-binding protein n=1 Tax=Zizania palustris TaxID=103762 RepID=A0A8J5WJU4_ZIZPA|nr:hypothetical protein GUJ93_ZPchr0011g27717 [Zizania palustris]
MCGRVRCNLSPAQAARAFGFSTTTSAAGGGGDGGGGGGGDASAVPMLRMDRYRPSYNVSPGAYLPVGTVRAVVPECDGGRGDANGEGPVIECMKWGLVPSFTGKTEKPDHFRMFNARSESIKEKASFRRLIPKNRCLVAVEGFYEWKKDGSKKQPYYIHLQDQRPLVFAALFDMWANSEGETIHTFTILTTRASTSLKWLHDRMPVILGDKDSINTWLNSSSVELEEITIPYKGTDLVWYPVTAAMGKTSFDGPECIKEVRPSEKPISAFFTRKPASPYCPVKSEKIALEIAETTAFRPAKEECFEPGENQSEQIYQEQTEVKQDESTIVKGEHITLHHDDDKAGTIKHEVAIFTDEAIRNQDVLSMKRKTGDTEVKLEIMVENTGGTPFVPVKKKKKGPKAASDGQASLFSYFAK